MSGQPPDARPIVLLGFAEAMAAIECAWSLRGAGFQVVAFTRRGARPALRHSRGVWLHEVCPPELDSGQTARDVATLVQTIRPASVLPLDDASLWICNRAELDDAPVAGGRGYACEVALDKCEQLRLAEAAGLLVPPTQVAEGLVNFIPADWPVVVKPARALYESDGKFMRPLGVTCADEAELAGAALRRWYPPLLVQPVIVGVGEGLFGHASSKGVVAWSAHRRLRMLNPEGSASSACISTPVDSHLIGPAEDFLRAIGWRGLFMLEFLRDAHGNAWFMELNGRAWGSMALARRRGFEYPAWTVKASLDPRFVPEPPPDPPVIRCRHLALEITHLAFVVRGPRSRALNDWPRLWPTLRAMLHISRMDRLYNWKGGEPRVFLADTWQTLRFYAGRIRRRKE